jgi:cohesin loading factor subunit SCC2
MFSALLLQLIQCEVNTIDYLQSSNNNDMLASYVNGSNGVENMDQNQAGQKNEVTFEEKESYIINSYDNSGQTAKKFLSVFFSKCKTKQADSDFRPIFENFIQDLLTTVNKPEWPVSETILNLLGIILVNQIQNDQNDVGSRVNSLEYLGQIVSQLRKDSLEYQKYPEKVKQVIDKINSNLTNSTENNLESLNLTDREIFNLQKSLIKYLDSLVANDSSLQYSKYYLVGQWLKELDNITQSNNNNSNPDGIEYGQERINKHNALEENRKRLYSLIESQQKNKNDDENEISSNIILEMNEAFILSKYLCSMKKTLDKNFDYYLINILSLSGGGSESQTPTQVRSKAIKCLSLIIEADPQILLKQKVFACVEANFLHQTISVREASVDLIGRFITLKPELTNHYYKLLSDRILDVGVSVRKRVIKIFRDVCLNQPDFEHLSEICCKILRRINDEDGIKKLVIDTFYSLWFSPISGSNSREQLLKRVLNLVDVVSEFNAISCNASTEIFEQLFNCLISNPAQGSSSGTSLTSISNTDINQSDSKTSIMASNSSTSAGGSSNTNEQELQLIKSKEVLKSCKQIVDCLIENVLNTEANTSSTQSYKRLVASFSTLYLLSKIKPENFINHAETLLPYLNIKATNQNDNQIINSAARILECVIPLLQSPSNSFLITLEESLCKLIFQGGMLIVSSCISCLGTVVNKLTKNYKLAADCFSKFYNNISILKRSLNLSKPLDTQVKPIVFRVLFTLGLLSKHFDVESPEFAEYKICSKQDLFQLFIFFMKSCDVDVQQKALIGLGSFLTRYSEYMMKDEIKKLYLTYIQQQNIPFILKSQIFINLTDYLNEEDQRNLAKSVELSKNHGCKDDLKEMLDVQSGMASTIIQSYLKPILDSYLTPNTTLRINVFNCLSMILNQGLVYPIECVPYLIAMTTDQEKKIQSRSLNHLTNLQKAHPGFVQSKSISGVNVSFLLQKIIKKSQLQQAVAAAGAAAIQTEFDNVVRGFSEQGEILSLNHHLYSLLRTNRSYRRAFLQQLLKMFDDSSLHHTSLAHMLFISDNLAYFPYQLIDEPLYLIHHIDLIISVTGINLLQTFKENLLNYKQTCEDSSQNIKKSSQFISDDNQLSDFDNQDCPIEADEEEAAKQHAGIIKNENGAIKKSTELDDDDETFEVVLNNLPNDLKPLKDCMYRAQGCCLLLILKLFLKEVYSISDSKIQNYSPNDTAKVNERPITSRKTNRRFNPKQIIDYMKKSEIKKTDQDDDEEEELKQSLVREYLEFKELILSIDQEENKFDDKSNSASTSNAAKTNPTDMTKMSTLQQKLMEGIEKTKVFIF